MGLFSKVSLWMFGKPPTPKELVRKHQRAINKAIRGLDRERYKMEQQEKKLISDIKKSATTSQMDICKIAATDLVRTRRYIKKFMMIKANLQAVSVKILTLQSQNSVSEAMLGVTMALRGMNQQMRLPQLQRIVMEFERQVQIMDLKEELMTEATENALGEDMDPDTESEELVAQVLDELGLQLTTNLPELPGLLKDRGSQKITADGSTIDDLDDDLQARLDNLRRD